MKTLLGVFVAAVMMLSAGAAWACPCQELAEEVKVLPQTVADQSAPVVAGRTAVTLKVGGITCTSCAYIVNRALRDVAGVHGVELRATDDPTVIIAVVDADQRLESGEELAAVTSGLGYPTEVIDDGAI